MTHPTLLLLGALSSASLGAPFAYAAPQETSTADEGAKCQCACAACVAKHGAKAAAENPEMAAVREALAAVEADMTREQRVAAVLGTELAQVEALLLEEPAEEEPVIVDFEITEFGVDAAALPSSGTFKFDVVMTGEPEPSERGYLGVGLGEGDDGIEIASVVPGSPAARGGVQQGDVIFNIAGTTVMDLEGLRAVMKRFRPGDTIGLGVMRDGRPVNLSAKLTELSAVRGGTVPEVEGTAGVVPPVPPAPTAPQSRERFRFLSTPEGMPGEIEVILAEPAEAVALQARINALEVEVAELNAMLIEIRRELKRRNSR